MPHIKSTLQGSPPCFSNVCLNVMKPLIGGCQEACTQHAEGIPRVSPHCVDNVQARHLPHVCYAAILLITDLPTHFAQQQTATSCQGGYWGTAMQLCLLGEGHVQTAA